MTLLCVGISVRPIVESARRSGADVFAVDYFGDLDTMSACPSLALRSRGSSFPPRPRDYAEACLEAGCDSFLYTAPLENHPSLVSRLQKKMELRGTSPRALRAVRDPATLRDFCLGEGIRFPEIRFTLPSPTEKRFLRKPRLSGGGTGIGPMKEPLPQSSYLQEFVEGIPCSATFVADGREAHLISVTRQLVGESWLGCSGFLWCGNVVPHSVGERHARTLDNICKRLTAAFSLVGCLGIDFMLSDEVFLLEVNPRLCGSMDAVERVSGTNLFTLHMDACEGTLARDFSVRGHCAKAILYAKRTVTPRGTERLLGTAVKDVPRPGFTVREGEPLCSVLAEGETEDVATENLRREVGKAERFFYEGSRE